jgi:3-hydroxyisobutyrate dehydrogenase-like beta-hydroxyacid dehydrogenase
VLAAKMAAIAEMMVVGQRAGVQPSVLLDAVSKRSGVSFALQSRTQIHAAQRVPEEILCS